MATADESHYGLVADLIREGDVVPFLGAGANLCDRPDGATWELGRYLPERSASSRRRLPSAAVTRSRDETRSAPRLAVRRRCARRGAVSTEYLRSFFDADYPPSSLHDFLARLPPLLRERGAAQQLVVTTNYDDLLERAFAKRGEPYDLLVRGEERRPARHVPAPSAGGEPVVIERPNEYDGLSPDERTVILKLHGAIDRDDPKGDSYVITEDNYIDYLTRRRCRRQIPIVAPRRAWPTATSSSSATACATGTCG